MIAIDAARLATSFTSGMLAAINPCGFVLLPAYLMYFLGMEQVRPSGERSSMLRALKVGAAVSGGFVAVFAVVGAITKWQSHWFSERAPWVSLAIGAALVALGVAMLFGYRLPFTTPQLDVGRRDRSVVSMFVFGVAYAVASIGCSLGLFLGNVLGGFSTDGFITGFVAIVMYALGMSLIVVGLTVSLAMANTWVLGALRRSGRYVDYAAGVVVMLSGVYLFYYWYSNLRDRYDDRVINRAEDWQQRLSNFVDRNQTAVVVWAVVAIAAALALGLWQVQRARRSDAR